MKDLGSFYVLSMGVIFMFLILSLLSFNGALRSLYVMFLLILLLVFHLLSIISYSLVLLVLMVYMSGLGVIFIYLCGVDYNSNLKFNFIFGVCGVIVYLGYSFMGKESLILYVLNLDVMFGFMFMVSFLSFLVVAGFIFILSSVSKDSICVRSRLKWSFMMWVCLA